MYGKPEFRLGNYFWRVLILIDQEFSFSYLNVYIRKIDGVAVAVIRQTASYYLKTHPAFQTLPVQYLIIVYRTRLEPSLILQTPFLVVVRIGLYSILISSYSRVSCDPILRPARIRS